MECPPAQSDSQSLIGFLCGDPLLVPAPFLIIISEHDVEGREVIAGPSIADPMDENTEWQRVILAANPPANA